MKKSLTKNLNEEEVAEIKEIFVDASRFREHLSSVLLDEVKSLQASMRNEKAFESPNWALFQADKVAQTKALLKVVSLLNEEKV